MIRKVAITLAVAFSAVLAAPATVEKRITGGEDAQQGDLPFIVYIRPEEEGWNRYCGGSLLDSTTVLTAAHCVDSAYSVTAGTLNPDTGGVTVKVASSKTHPDWNPDEANSGNYAINDIGILKLSTPIEKSEMIGYATLPANGSDPVADSSAIIAGWGSSSRSQYVLIGDGGTVQLKKAIVPIHAREVCSNLDRDAAGRDTIVCTGGNGKTACAGDSGGPLVDSKTQELIGISSWVIIDEEHYYCNQAPSVYTRVGSYISFIDENLGGAGSGSNPDKGDNAPSPSQLREKIEEKANEACELRGIGETACRRVKAECIFRASKANPQHTPEQIAQCVTDQPSENE